ncbi:MAG: B12-binding domain-containing radical SAM protein [Magnetococcales bacterium]|nr:B12-binding domain-containing radical SAM protein [Magnetococcales bacterium]
MTPTDSSLAAETGSTRTTHRTRAQDGRSVRALIRELAAPVPCDAMVTLIRPFAVMSKHAYSTPITPPIGPAYLAAVIEAAGYPVAMIDGIGEEIQRVVASGCGRFNLQGLSAAAIIGRIPSDTRVIGISMMFSQEWLEHRRLIQGIRDRFPAARIVVGGEHVTALTEYVLRDCPAIDYAVIGEGELTFLELVHALFHDAPVDGIGGVAHLTPAGVMKTGVGSRIGLIDELPRPAWHLLQVRNYFIDNWTMGIAMGRNMPILASRGCPYQCTFCSNPGMWSTRYKLRDVQEVIAEIQWLIQDFGANSIDFFDLTAIVRKEWMLRFCAALKANGLSIIWQLPSGTRCEALDEEVLRAIFAANCRYLVYAPESGSERTLKRIKKRLNLRTTLSSIQTALRVGHTVKVNFVIGFPDDETRDVLRTLGLILRLAWLGVHDCNVAIFTPYPGSELFDELREAGAIPALDDAYIATLICQFDLTVAQSFCRHLSGRSLMLFRLMGQLGFYALSYLRRPWRLVNLVRGVLRPGTIATNLLEQRIFDLLARRRLLSKG